MRVLTFIAPSNTPIKWVADRDCVITGLVAVEQTGRAYLSKSPTPVSDLPSSGIVDELFLISTTEHSLLGFPLDKNQAVYVQLQMASYPANAQLFLQDIT